MPKPDDESCNDCRFFKADDQVASLVGRDGWCMRYPPSVMFVDQETQRQLSRFPTVPADWWCGEYKQGPFPAT